MWFLWTATVALAVLVALGYLEKKHKRNGVYTQPGICYGLKRLLAWVHFKFVRARRVPRVHNYTYRSEDFVTSGVLPCPEDEDAEQCRPLDFAEAADGVSFFGCDSAGAMLLVRLVRRPGRQAEALLLLRLDGRLYQLPGMPDTAVYNTAGDWTAEGLSMECVVPMRLWRVTYRGQLRTCSARTGPIAEDDGGATCEAGELVPARLDLLWQPLSAPADLRDCDTALTVQAVARELWTPEFLSLMGSFSLDGYAQFGCLRGEVALAGAAPVELRLRGPRLHRWAAAGGPQAARRHRSLRLQARLTDGSSLLLMADSWRDGITHLVYGMYMNSALKVEPLTSCSLSLPDLAEEQDVPDVFNFLFSAGSKSHAVSIMIIGSAKSYSERPWRWMNKFQIARVCVDGEDGAGVMEFGYPYAGPCPLRAEVSLPRLVGLTPAVDAAPVVAFDEPACRCETLVGGKAASLALLCDLDLAEVAVPRGVVVTAAGYRQHLRRHPPLRRLVDEVVRVAAGRQEGNLREACERAVKEIQDTPVSKEIMIDVEAMLKKEFGEEFSSLRFAVRSSALGEDGEEASSAGQNATLLGCRGLEQVAAGLSRCWASLFAPHAVQYRRQHGQHVNPGMGVVVQRMVAAEVSGVMFTRDPLTGDPSVVTITASFGLGESVVSARVEPDTITISRSRTDQLTVIGRQRGSKLTQTVMTDDGGTEERPLDATSAAASCLADAAALRLARVGLHLEKAFGGARDVEWAVLKDQLYLLQSRPVTSVSTWSEWELTHEFDAALLTDDELFTTANTGEVLPRAVTPLTQSTLCQLMAIESHRMRRSLVGRSPPFPPYTGQYLPIFNYRYMIDYGKMFMTSLQSWEEDETEQAIQLTICGHLVDTRRARRTALKRYGRLSGPVQAHQMVSLMRMAWNIGADMRRAQAEFGQFTLRPLGLASAQQAFRYICAGLPQIMRAVRAHVVCTSFGNFVQVAVLSLLSEQGSHPFDQDMLSDFAALLSSCGAVESADVPAALRRLGRRIAAAPDAAEFVSAAPEDAAHWLRHRHGTLASAFRDFLAVHGHRAVNELDLHAVTWSMEPKSVITTLQAMVKNPASLEDSKTDTDVSQAMSQLRTPVSSFTRRLVAFLLPYARLNVARREQTKSLLVRVVHQLRMAFRHLGQLMVHESRMPDVDLIFFMTLYEIKSLLHTRSPAIIIKAARRRRLLPRLDQQRFPELMHGVPRPLPLQSAAAAGSGDLVVTGTPVCRGQVEGVARVVLNVAEADSIQGGDILVTHATDIGWSPYFPVLGGVVTELGGLISHGAVVAREYGLPCLVGATGATDLLRSGDVVVLDGTQGTLTRLRRSE